MYKVIATHSKTEKVFEMGSGDWFEMREILLRTSYTHRVCGHSVSRNDANSVTVWNEALQQMVVYMMVRDEATA
jgi:hypothetical protein